VPRDGRESGVRVVAAADQNRSSCFFDFALAARLPALVARSPNTQRAYASDWRGFVPARHPDVLRTFRIHSAGRAMKQSKAPLSHSAIERALVTYETQLPQTTAH